MAALCIEPNVQLADNWDFHSFSHLQIQSFVLILKSPIGEMVNQVDIKNFYTYDTILKAQRYLVPFFSLGTVIRRLKPSVDVHLV